MSTTNGSLRVVVSADAIQILDSSGEERARLRLDPELIATHLALAMEHMDDLRSRIDRALALTDTGSPEFRQRFPHAFDAQGVYQGGVPGWRVVEEIRQVLGGF